jgi:hypothetical protein
LRTTKNGEAAVKFPTATTSELGFKVNKKGYTGESYRWIKSEVPEAVTCKLQRNHKDYSKENAP